MGYSHIFTSNIQIHSLISFYDIYYDIYDDTIELDFRDA